MNNVDDDGVKRAWRAHPRIRRGGSRDSPWEGGKILKQNGPPNDRLDSLSACAARCLLDDDGVKRGEPCSLQPPSSLAVGLRPFVRR